jgi:hypothetical protein
MTRSLQAELLTALAELQEVHQEWCAQRRADGIQDGIRPNSGFEIRPGIWFDARNVGRPYRTGNPNHKGSGPRGGQFTSGGGAGHGKHSTKRKRRKARLLAKLQSEGHARLAKVREQHRKDRRALRQKQRQSGASYADRRSEYKALSAKQKGERHEVLKEIKADVRKQTSSIKIKAKGESDKLKEFRERRDKGSAKLAEIHAGDRQKMADNQSGERKELHASLRAERQEIRDGHATQRQDVVARNQGYHREDARHIIANTHGEPIEARRAALKANRETHLGRLKEDLASHREERQQDIEGHKEQTTHEIAKLDRSHREIRQYVARAHKAERRSAIDKLKAEVKGGQRGIEIKSENDQRDQWTRAISEPPMERQTVGARFPRSKLHKASSAESILAHVLKQRAWTARWRDGKLTDRQRRQLLEDVRQYGRAWMRHEAESFFAEYGDEGSGRIRDGSNRELGHNGDHQSEGVLRQSCEITSNGGDGQDQTMRGLSDQVLSPLRRWFTRSRQFIRELIHAGVSALRGGTLNAEEAKEADQLADVQDEYFNGFEREMIDSPPEVIAEASHPAPRMFKRPLTRAQFVARAEQYGNAPWQAAQRINHKHRKAFGGWRWERRILGNPKTEHCHDCPPLAALGWQPIGTLPEIGLTECGGLCLCHFEYSDQTEAPVSKVKPVPKKVSLAGKQEAIDALLSNPEFNEAMKRLNLTMKVHVGSGG